MTFCLGFIPSLVIPTAVRPTKEGGRSGGTPRMFAPPCCPKVFSRISVEVRVVGLAVPPENPPWVPAVNLLTRQNRRHCGGIRPCWPRCCWGMSGRRYCSPAACRCSACAPRQYDSRCRPARPEDAGSSHWNATADNFRQSPAAARARHRAAGWPRSFLQEVLRRAG